jgi:hypothetical protein
VVVEALASAAVITAVELAEMLPAVAVKLAVAAPAATVTEDGTDSSVLFEASATVDPPDGAAPLSVTVQAADPLEASLLGAQLKEERVGATAAIVILHVAETLCPALSCTSTVTLDVPAATGVPLIAPEEEKTRPAAREPAVSNQL